MPSKTASMVVVLGSWRERPGDLRSLLMWLSGMTVWSQREVGFSHCSTDLRQTAIFSFQGIEPTYLLSGLLFVVVLAYAGSHVSVKLNMNKVDSGQRM